MTLQNNEIKTALVALASTIQEGTKMWLKDNQRDMIETIQSGDLDDMYWDSRYIVTLAMVQDSFDDLLDDLDKTRAEMEKSGYFDDGELDDLMDSLKDTDPQDVVGDLLSVETDNEGSLIVQNATDPYQITSMVWLIGK